MSNYTPRPAEAQITREEFAARRRQLLDAIGPNAVAIIPGAVEKQRNSDVHYPFRQDSDFQYLTGFPEADAWAVLAPGHEDGEFVLFCRPKDKEKEIWDGYRAGPEGCVANYGADRAEVIGDLNAHIPQLLKDREVVHFSSGSSVSNDRALQRWLASVRGMARSGVSAPTQVHQLGAVLHEQRLRKSSAEQAMMRYAAQVSAAAHVRAMQKVHNGLYEFQLGAEIHHDFERHGMSCAYGSIVGGGANACVLHYVENKAPLHDGDLVLIDAGGEFEGYCADITRTFPVSGKFSPAQKAVYDIVLASQVAAIDVVKTGARWMAAHEVVVPILTQGLLDLGLLKGSLDEAIEKQSYMEFFMHKTGHWLGMDVHDVGPYRVEGDWRKLEPGMVLTIEPGLYISANSPGVSDEFANIGIRIEDDVLVTEGEADVLTRDVPKTTDAIEAVMAQA
ncbi:MAG: aminopeptidase P N-terminal domain-containing protein [Oceanococcus sp.]